MTDEFRKASDQLRGAILYLAMTRDILKTADSDESGPLEDMQFVTGVPESPNAIRRAEDDLARVAEGDVALPSHRHHGGVVYYGSAHGAALELLERCTKWKGPGYPPDLFAPELNLSRLAALLKREREKLDATPQPAPMPPVAETGEQVSLDARALALYLQNQNRTKKDIAKLLGLNNTQSLAPGRCPQLHMAMKAYKEVNANDRRTTKGNKGKDGTLEAYAEDE